MVPRVDVALFRYYFGFRLFFYLVVVRIPVSEIFTIMKWEYRLLPRPTEQPPKLTIQVRIRISRNPIGYVLVTPLGHGGLRWLYLEAGVERANSKVNNPFA
ncbi:uncharacterized protein EI97DRAFT_30066 [Westerdykella ornata]|uniref:Uncharacterized protein n=1 Tax=Westerdykella ornata TaxID=318751 RepID=A0A6A6JZF5_WESOR|nr:uncharacterized protein EI97DRAFT_30066 [Westerdykella ornata]KAF2281463.1 hypothetical protein EI97DRAFT_30066 [Westerdykella ornata]